MNLAIMQALCWRRLLLISDQIRDRHDEYQRIACRGRSPLRNVSGVSAAVVWDALLQSAALYAAA